MVCRQSPRLKSGETKSSSSLSGVVGVAFLFVGALVASKTYLAISPFLVVFLFLVGLV